MRIVVHDVLQSSFLSPAQQKAFKQKTPIDWFKECMTILKGNDIKLAIIAEGIGMQFEWIDLIKENKWEVQCHGLFHREMHKFDKEKICNELKLAKESIEDCFNQKVTEFYPPRLKTCPAMYEVCRELQMDLSFTRWRPNHAIEGINTPEVYVHFWSENHLKQCLRMREKQLIS